MSKLKTALIICLAITASALISGCATFSDKVNPYPFNTAQIQYKLEGNLEGEQTVYIKGDMSAHRTVAVKTMEGVTDDVDILYVEAGPARYEINLITRTGTKSPNPIYEEMSRMDRGQKIEFLTRIATFTEENEPTPVSLSEKEVAGQTCKIYAIRDFGEICLWNGIPLYSKISLAAGEIENTMTAVSVQTGMEIDDNVFGIPLDVEIGDLAAA